MSNETSCRQVVARQIISPVVEFFDLHQDIASALLAGFDDGAPQSINLRCSWMNNAARSLQRHKPRHAEFRQFLDEDVGTIRLGQWRGEFEVEAKLADRRLPSCNP